MREVVLSGIRPSFPGLSQREGQVTHVLLPRSPLEYPRKGLSARLACVKHAASVRPEPGSNSPTKTCQKKCPDNKQMCCQRNPHKHSPKTMSAQGQKNIFIGTGFYSTLLSSQRTNTHRHKPLERGSTIEVLPLTYPRPHRTVKSVNGLTGAARAWICQASPSLRSRIR